MFGYYPTFHTLTSVGRKSTSSMLKICFRFSLLFSSFAVQNICLYVHIKVKIEKLHKVKKNIQEKYVK